MGNIDLTWQHVQELVDNARQQIIDSVKAMLAKINTDKIEELNRLCTEYKCKMWLVLDEDGANPFLIRPLMYIWFYSSEMAVIDKWHSILKEMGWASSNRITLKLVEKPYEGEFLFSYPHVWGEKDET